MGVVDAALEEYLEDPKRYADLLNGYWFGGRQTIQPEDLQEKDSRLVGRSQRTQEKNSKKRYRQRIRDKVRKIVLGAGVMVVALENQTQIHHAMPVRVMLEDALEYDKQYKAIQVAHEGADDLSDAEEYLSKFKASDRILPTATIVVYFGEEEWTGPRDLLDLMELENIPKEVHPFINGYPLHILEVQKFEDIDRFRTDLREVFGFIQCANDKKKLHQFMEQNQEFFRAVKQDVVDVITAVTGKKRLREILEEHQKEGEADMSIGLEILTKEERAAERMEGKKVTARNASNMGFSVDETAKLCDVSLDTMREWFAEWDLES